MEQTIGRGLRLPFGEPTREPDLDELEIMSHDNYAQVVAEARNHPWIRTKELTQNDTRPVDTVRVTHPFVDIGEALARLKTEDGLFATADLADENRLNEVVEHLAREKEAAIERRTQVAAASAEAPAAPGAQLALEGTVVTQPAIERPDPGALRAEYRSRLIEYARLVIDVPNIREDIDTELRLDPSDVKVNVGPFSLVVQRTRIARLQTGEARDAGEVEVLEQDNPRGHLAGRVIDESDDLEVAVDKEAALALVDRYIRLMGVTSEELGKLVHLYREEIVRDPLTQVADHVQERTRTTYRVLSGTISFREYPKTVLRKEGIVDFRARTSRSTFRGYSKSIYPQAAYGSTPEKDLAIVLEDDPAVLKWVRPPEGNVPISSVLLACVT